MSMTKQSKLRNDDQLMILSMDELVPKDHLVRKIEHVVDWSFIYPLVAEYYGEKGRPSVDPVVLFKMLFLNYVFGIHSMRKTCDEIAVNVAYRWFLGFDFTTPVPNYSTYSKNYERRFKETDVHARIFTSILLQIQNAGLIDMSALFIDSTHVKANANRNKYTRAEVEVEASRYTETLLDEINVDREQSGKKPLKPSNQEVKTKEIKQSTTDPESGLFHKGEKEKCFAYTSTIASTRHGFIIHAHTTPGNVHDSVSFLPFYHALNAKYQSYIKYIVVDAGYKTPMVCHEIFAHGHIPVMPYKRPMTKPGYFKKQDFVYDAHYDVVHCPEEHTLTYRTTTREGYRHYISDPKVCKHCPSRHLCNASRDYKKHYFLHIWHDEMDEVEHIRHTDIGKEIYKRRKETVERNFADGKEKHGLRFSRYRTLKTVDDHLLLLYAAMNLKKWALVVSRTLLSSFLFLFFLFNI